MAEWTYALASVADLKQVVSIDSLNTGQDSVLELVIKRTSESIETYCQRHFVTRGEITEYHTPLSYCADLYLGQYPVIAITSVKEGSWSGGAWTVGLTLTANSDYLLASNSGRLLRMSAGASAFWPMGLDAVQVAYTAGYADTASVPGPIKDVCLSVAARKYSQIRRGGDFSAQSSTDAMGTVSRFLPADLLSLDQKQLYPWRQIVQSTTGRR